MKINISGHHVEITDGIKQALDNKFVKIAKHFPTIMSIDAMITVETHQQKLEVITNYEGASVAVHAADKDLYVAIASAAKKLESALEHRKGVLKAKANERYEVPQSDTFEVA